MADWRLVDSMTFPRELAHGVGPRVRGPEEDGYF